MMLFGAIIVVLAAAVGRRAVSERRLRRQLQSLTPDAPTFDPSSVNVDNLASLAVASGLAASASPGRWRRWQRGQ